WDRRVQANRPQLRAFCDRSCNPTPQPRVRQLLESCFSTFMVSIPRLFLTSHAFTALHLNRESFRCTCPTGRWRPGNSSNLLPARLPTLTRSHLPTRSRSSKRNG